MIRRVVTGCLIFIALYTGLIWFQVFTGSRKGPAPQAAKAPEALHKVHAFSFAKYTPEGQKEIEIEGDSANILEETVMLINVVAKAYAEETPVTITADTGNYDKANNKVRLQNNVIATADNGTRLLTEQLEILPTQKTMETEAPAQVKKDNIDVQGTGARGDSGLKKVKFNKNVKVIVQDPNDKVHGPTVITCMGPLVIDYQKNVAFFKDQVVAEDSRGKLSADSMDVYYNKVSKKVSKIVALGNVVIENPDGNKTFSDSVIYLAEEGRVILGGDTEALYYEGSQADRIME